jgi:hypothetical protein
MFFVQAGTISFTVPEGVYSLSAVGIGGGGGGGLGSISTGGGSGGGGALAYVNNIPVTPGEVLTLTIAAGGNRATYSSSTYTQGTAGGPTIIARADTTVLLRANGGNQGNSSNSNANGGGSGGTVVTGTGGPGQAGAAPASGTNTGPGGNAGRYDGSAASRNGQGAALYGLDISGPYGAGGSSNTYTGSAQSGSNGAIRLIWGDGKVFPGTSAALILQTPNVELFRTVGYPASFATRKQIADIYAGLSSAGLLNEISSLYVFAQSDATYAVRDLIVPTRIATFVGGPVFTQNAGYMLDGVDDYIDTGFAAGSVGDQSAMGVRLNVHDASANPIMGAQSTGSGMVALVPRSAGNLMQGAWRQSSLQQGAVTHAATKGLYVLSRNATSSASDALVGYRDGAREFSSTSGIGGSYTWSGNIRIGTFNGTFRSGQVAMAFVCNNNPLADANVLAIHNWFESYRATIGLT